MECHQEDQVGGAMDGIIEGSWLKVVMKQRDVVSLAVGMSFAAISIF